ncbi:MAG TPA: lysophospholipid acyltransferase family protein [Candidatus Binatia bacterium]|nr:lysophospholipid acyltransferase family protein [Candidatus Binatia bacterium]
MLRSPISAAKRWRSLQRLKNTFLYLLMRGVLFVIERVPMRGFVRLVGCVSPYIFRQHTRRAQEHLRATLPHLDATKTTRRMFVHLAESVWELSRLRRSVPDLDGEARRVLDEALAEGKGVIFISGHVGNWEMLGQAIAAAGYPLVTIATPFYDPRVTKWVDHWRTRRGLKIIWREENSGKAILRALRRNDLIAFLIDQNTRTAGDYVPFFGRPAFTPTTPAALALRTGAPMVFCWHHRHGKTHRITVERVVYHPTGDRRRDVLALTEMLTARLESVIRMAPEQWVWMHRRWRTSRRPTPVSS